MVKRKDGLPDKKEKAERAKDVVRKVSKKLDLDEMDPIVKDGELLVKKGDEVYFERLREDKQVVVCVGTVVSTYANGGIDVWDETHNSFFLLNWKKLDTSGIKVRWQAAVSRLMAQKTAEPVVEVAPQSDLGEALDGIHDMMDVLEGMPGLYDDAEDLDDEGNVLVIDADTDDV